MLFEIDFSKKEDENRPNTRLTSEKDDVMDTKNVNSELLYYFL